MFGAHVGIGPHIKNQRHTLDRGKGADQRRASDAANASDVQNARRHRASGIACRDKGLRFSALHHFARHDHRTVGFGAHSLRRLVIHLDHLAGSDDRQI